MSINISRTDGKAPQKINHISLRASNEQLEIIEAESRAVNMNRSGAHLAVVGGVNLPDREMGK